MNSFGTCKLCGEKISYSPDNIDNYGLHLVERHPEIDFAHFALCYNEDVTVPGDICECGCGCRQQECIHKKGLRGKRTGYYKTTIQSWRSAQNPQYCPRCQKSEIPIMKRQRNKLTGSSTLACMVLGCWPLCFLPFIISGSDLFYIYCKCCGYFIGAYDRRLSAADPSIPKCRLPSVGGEGQICACD